MFPLPNQGVATNMYLFWSNTIQIVSILSCLPDSAEVFAGARHVPVAIMDKIAVKLSMPMTDLRWCGTTSGGTGNAFIII